MSRREHSRWYLRRYGDQLERLKFYDALKHLTDDDRRWVDAQMRLASQPTGSLDAPLGSVGIAW